MFKTMSDVEKCKTYKETESSIQTLLEKGISVDKNVYINQLISIKTDLVAKNENVRKVAQEVLDFLLNLQGRDIQTEIIKTLLDPTVNKLVQNYVLKSIKNKVKDTILEDKFNFTENLLPWKNQNVNKLTNIIEEVCLNDLSRDKCKQFFIYKVIPAMMELSTDNEIRNILIDMAFMLSTIVPISDLITKELEIFLKDVNLKYVKNIGDLRDQNYTNWHNLWIFLVRFCDKNIHNSMELTNRLLRVVEYAFRNSSSQQRLKGYDCWKELIDNASLDMKHMCSPKQIKLLVTPLKAKFSKQEVVICKRFDVFAYLLEKLQHKAVLCLTEFLEFCFGPIGDNKDTTKVGQGKTVAQIWTKSTKVLVDIIGHSHGKSISCLITEDVIKLEKPVINHTNISSHYKVIINSVGECGSLLKEVDIEAKRETVIKCMWKSVFNLVIPTSDTIRSKYFQVISDVLDNYVKQSRENPYFEDLLILIVTVLFSYDKDFVYEAVQYILKQLLTIIFTIDNFPADGADNFRAILSHAFSKMLMVENKLRVVKDVMVSFMKVLPNEENISHINKIWLCVANELILDFTTQQIEEFVEFNSFFMWPAFHLHHLDESAKKQTVLYWMKLYRKISLDSEERKQGVMKELEKIFKNNPLLSSDVVSLLNVMSQFETKFTKEFVIKLMGVSSLILLLPNLKTEDEQKITALVMQYFEPSLECYKCVQNEEVIRNICVCIENILRFHKGYKLLDTLASFIRNSPNDLRAKFSQCLSNLILDFYNKESDVNGYNAKELYKVIQVFSETSHNKPVNPSPFIGPGGRSARIANLAKNSPRTPQLKSKRIEPSPVGLRLFGKDPDTLSPLRVKGSQLNTTTPTKSRNIVNSPKSNRKSSLSLNDEKSSEFVPIDTEVKFQPEKLSTHQREVLKKRREDIPALYQDLSQSMSQDMFNSSSSSRSMDQNDKGNSVDKKVIVEVIEHHFQKEDPPKMDFVVPPQHIEEITVPNSETNTDSDLFASHKLETVDPEETLYEPPETTDTKCQMDHEPSHGITEDLVRTEEICEENNPQIVSETKSESKVDSQDEKEKKRKMKIEAELQKLKMDIVGAEEFFATSRRTRTREKPKKLEEGVKPRGVSKEEPHSRISLGETKPETKAEKMRRKTIGSLKDIKSPKPSVVEAPKLKEKTQSETPKITRRRSVKTKGATKEENKSEESKDQMLITPIEVELKKEETQEEVEKAKDVKEKKGQKRKRSSCDEESEDIIESSQESPTDVTPIFNTSKRRSFLRTSVEEKLEKSEERTLVQQKTVTIDDFVSNTSEEVQDGLENVVFEDRKVEDVMANKVITEDVMRDGEIVMETEYMPAHVASHEEVPAHVEEVSEEIEIGHVIEEVVNDNVVEEKLYLPEALMAVNITQDTTLTQETSQEVSTPEDLSQDDTQDMDTQETETQSLSTQDTQTQEIPTQSDFGSEDTRPPVPNFDLPKKPELTDSERIICRMDTMSICSYPNNPEVKNQSMKEVEENKGVVQSDSLGDDVLLMEDVLASPSAQINNLPSSPVTVETPNRTTELLNNTLNISPINSKSSSDSDTLETPSVLVSRNFKAEMEELDRIEKENNAEAISQPHTNIVEASEIASTAESVTNISKEVDSPSKVMEHINQSEELPNSVEDIINILEGNPMKAPEEIPETEVAEHVEEVSQHFDIRQHLEDVENQIEGHPHHAEYIQPQKDYLEEVQQQIEEIPIQTRELSPQNDMVENQRQSEGLAEQMEGIPNQIEVVKPLKESNGMQERTSKLLNMINVSSPATHKIFIKKRAGGVSMSPSSGRIKRLMLGIHQKPSVDLVGEVKEEDILTFSREVPSPLAVPRGSILKRKLSDISDEGVSPCPKRKRVNFSDPCLTSKKVFIKDDYRDNILLEAKCLFPETPEAKPKDGHPKHVPESPAFAGVFDRMTESEIFETEPSLEVTNPLILRKDRPIYPKLVDCKEDVITILKRVTSPMFISTLMNKLRNKDIKTIGELARQSEAEINRFPFKVPVVANVYRALDNYYKKNVDKGGKDGVENSGAGTNEDEEGEKCALKRTSPVKGDIRMEFKELVEKSKVLGITEDLTKILLQSLEQQQIITLIKSHYQLMPKDFLQENDFKSTIKHITDRIGLSSIFEMLTESIESSENESVYFDCMIKHSIDKRPLIDLLENRSLIEIKTGLEEIVHKNVFTKKDVLENCLLPLIENPSDISGYLNRISVLQLGDIVIKRLEHSDLKQFFSQIMEVQGGRNVVTSLNSELFKYFDSAAEIVDSFKNCISVQSEERQNEVMIEMFKYISGRLSLNTLLELHVGFLQRIPHIIASSKEK